MYDANEEHGNAVRETSRPNLNLHPKASTREEYYTRKKNIKYHRRKWYISIYVQTIKAGPDQRIYFSYITEWTRIRTRPQNETTNLLPVLKRRLLLPYRGQRLRYKQYSEYKAVTAQLTNSAFLGYATEALGEVNECNVGQFQVHAQTYSISEPVESCGN